MASVKKSAEMFKLEDRVLFDAAAVAEIVEAEAVVENPDPEANQSETDRQAQEDRNALKNAGPADDGAGGAPKADEDGPVVTAAVADIDARDRALIEGVMANNATNEIEDEGLRRLHADPPFIDLQDEYDTIEDVIERERRAAEEARLRGEDFQPASMEFADRFLAEHQRRADELRVDLESREAQKGKPDPAPHPYDGTERIAPGTKTLTVTVAEDSTDYFYDAKEMNLREAIDVVNNDYYGTESRFRDTAHGREADGSWAYYSARLSADDATLTLYNEDGTKTAAFTLNTEDGVYRCEADGDYWHATIDADGIKHDADGEVTSEFIVRDKAGETVLNLVKNEDYRRDYKIVFSVSGKNVELTEDPLTVTNTHNGLLVNATGLTVNGEWDLTVAEADPDSIFTPTVDVGFTGGVYTNTVMPDDLNSLHVVNVNSKAALTLNSVKFDGADTHIFNNGGDVTFGKDVVFKNGMQSVANAGKLVFTDTGKVRFENNSLNAIYTMNGFETKGQVEFIANSGQEGAAIHVDGGATVTINKGTVFDRNTAYKGGAVYVGSGTLNVKDGTFTGNRAIGRIEEEEGEVIPTNENGGAIYVEAYGALEITGGEFSKNAAGSIVAVIDDERNAVVAKAVWDGKKFGSYEVKYAGRTYGYTVNEETGVGTLHTVDGQSPDEAKDVPEQMRTILLAISSMDGAAKGGAIYAEASESDSTLRIANAKFTDNLAGLGGAVHSERSVDVLESEFTGNKALQTKEYTADEAYYLSLDAKTLWRHFVEGEGTVERYLGYDVETHQLTSYRLIAQQEVGDEKVEKTFDLTFKWWKDSAQGHWTWKLDKDHAYVDGVKVKTLAFAYDGLLDRGVWYTGAKVTDGDGILRDQGVSVDFSSKELAWIEGLGKGDGAAIWSGGRILDSFDNHYAKNVSEGNGGAVYLTDGARELSLVLDTFEDNRARLDGGAVFVGSDVQTVTVDCVLFDSNTADNGGAIFFSTHVLEVAEKLCDKVAIIKDGRLIRSGTMEDVKGDESLEDVFLELEG